MKNAPATFHWKADELDAAGLQARVGASTLTLGGLLENLALVEDFTFRTEFRGDPPGEIWRPAAQDEHWVCTSSADDSPEELYAFWKAPSHAPEPPSPTAGSTSPRDGSREVRPPHSAGGDGRAPAT